eukprot:14849026-Alexandrium_andersonii.AAC.1
MFARRTCALSSIKTRTWRCRPRLPSPACARNSYGVCAGLGRRRRAGKLSVRRLWRASGSSEARPALDAVAAPARARSA